MNLRFAAVMQKPTDPSGGVRLLGADEPPPFLAERRQGRSNFLITVDHASSRIPRSLRDLGLPPSELKRHIAWDIGALAVARQVSAALDAPLVAQNYSRLVIDCNRDPKVDSSIPKLSESTEIPGNLRLSAAESPRAASRSSIPITQRCALCSMQERRRAGPPSWWPSTA
jgi:predicted N-formylglutamate amidohydrolase